MPIFVSPDSRGCAPLSSWRARLPASTTNSNRFSFGARSTVFLWLKCRPGPETRPNSVLCLYLRRPAESAGPSRTECPDNRFGRSAHGFHASPLGQHNRAQAIHCPVQLVVDHHVFVRGELADLAPGGLESIP